MIEETFQHTPCLSKTFKLWLLFEHYPVMYKKQSTSQTAPTAFPESSHPFPPQNFKPKNHLSKIQGASAPTANSDWPRLRWYPYQYHVLHPHYGRWCLPFRRWNHFAPHWRSPGRKGWTIWTAERQGKCKPCLISCFTSTSLSLVHRTLFFVSGLLLLYFLGKVLFCIMICHLQLQKKGLLLMWISTMSSSYIHGWSTDPP